MPEGCAGAGGVGTVAGRTSTAYWCLCARARRKLARGEQRLERIAHESLKPRVCVPLVPPVVESPCELQGSRREHRRAAVETMADAVRAPELALVFEEHR